MGSSFQEYNFTELAKYSREATLSSPIADGRRLYHNNNLMDIAYVGTDYCYRLDFRPKAHETRPYGKHVDWRKAQTLKQIDVCIGNKPI